MNSKQHKCRTAGDTFALGVSTGESLEGGEVLLLSGPLGSGKTLFTKGILRGLEFDDAEVTSPSFTLVNFYGARLPVYHIDLWRIDDPEGAAVSVGLHDLLEEEEAVIIIEWAERLGSFEFPGSTISVELKGDGDDTRTVTIERS